MHLLELKIGALCCGDRQGDVVNLLVELVQYLIGDDGLKAVDNAVLVLLGAVFILLLVAVQELQAFFNVVAVGHVDEPKELVLVVDCVM